MKLPPAAGSSGKLRVAMVGDWDLEVLRVAMDDSGGFDVVSLSRWWQLKYFLFSPLFGEDSHFDSYFSDGWFNHQLVMKCREFRWEGDLSNMPCRNTWQDVESIRSFSSRFGYRMQRRTQRKVLGHHESNFSGKCLCGTVDG